MVPFQRFVPRKGSKCSTCFKQWLFTNQSLLTVICQVAVMSRSKSRLPAISSKEKECRTRVWCRFISPESRSLMCTFLVVSFLYQLLPSNRTMQPDSSISDGVANLFSILFYLWAWGEPRVCKTSIMCFPELWWYFDAILIHPTFIFCAKFFAPICWNPTTCALSIRSIQLSLLDQKWFKMHFSRSLNPIVVGQLSTLLFCTTTGSYY